MKHDSNELARLEKLRSYQLLDTIPEKEFDDIVAIASELSHAPMALISLIDESRQWFKACIGLDGVSETPRDIAFCDHAIRQREPLVVRDATKDPRFANNPLVTGPPAVRFYAGIPLWTSDNYCIGTLCVIDMTPRDLSANQLKNLQALGRLVMAHVELRSNSSEIQLDMRELKRAKEQYEDLQRAIPAGIYTVDKEGRCTSVNAQWLKMMDLTRDQGIGYGWRQSIVEDDRLALLAQGEKAKVSTAHMETPFRIRRQDGSIRHMISYSAPSRAGGRIGCIWDVTESAERIDDLKKQLRDLMPSMLKNVE